MPLHPSVSSQQLSSPEPQLSPPDRLSSKRQKQHYSKLTLISYWSCPPILVVCHIGSLLALSTGLSLSAWLWIIFLYEIRMLAITGIYHRLLTHRSYSAIAPVKWIGSIVACSAAQMGPSWWKGHHNEHHRHSDQQGDPHNSTNGFSWSHYGWLLTADSFLPSSLPADIEQDPILRLIDRFHFVPAIALALLSYAIGGSEFLAAFFISTTLLFHGVATVNSLCHWFGSKPFKSNDRSRNNWFVAALTLGEGWHSCHHAFPWSARQGITISKGNVKYLPDPTLWFINTLQFFGAASKPKEPSKAELLAASTSAITASSQQQRLSNFSH